MVLIYVAGPYTRPDPAINTHNAIEAANRLWDRGYCPVIPHLSHFWHVITPKSYDEWLAMDMEYLKRCDGMLRLPGESPGADQEMQLAREFGIPIFHEIDEIQYHDFTGGA